MQHARTSFPQRAAGRHRRWAWCGAAAALAVASLDPMPAAALTGQVLVLPGAGARLEIPDAPDLHGSRQLTVAAWFRSDELRGWEALAWKGDLPDAHPWRGREIGLFLHGRGYVHLASTPVSRQQRGQLYVNTPGGRVRAGRWHHVAAVLASDAAGGAMRIYLDGELAASRPYDASGLHDATGPLCIGAIPGRDADFRGRVDEVQVWRRALSADEVRSTMGRQLRGDEAGLLAYYRFDEARADGVVPDRSGHGHHGRLAGGAHLRAVELALPAVAVLPTSPVRVAAPSTSTTTTTTTDPAGTTTTTTTTSSPASGPVTMAGAPVAAVVLPAAVTGTAPVAAPVDDTTIRGDQALLVVQSLDHGDADVRRRAARLLDRLEPQLRVHALRTALASSDAEVRRRAARLLGQVERPHLSGLTQVALVSDDAWVVEQAERSVAAARTRWGDDWDAPATSAQTPETAIAGTSEPVWDRGELQPGPDFWGLREEGVLARYNRVDGLFLGWRQRREYRGPRGIAHYGEVGRAFQSEAWRWQAGGEVFTFYGPPTSASHLAAIGGEVHDLTDTEDGWRLSQDENSVHALLFRRDHFDYFRRSGGSLYTTHTVGGVLQLTGSWGWDRYRSLRGEADWALLDSRWTEAAFRANPVVDEGSVRRLRGEARFDTRDEVRMPDRGWLVHAFGERAGGVLGGDHRFKRFVVDARRYQPVGRGTRLDARLRAGTAKGALPEPFVFQLGGMGSLRGYQDRALAGDRALLVNLGYWIDADRHWRGDLPVDGLGLGLFFDAGAAWFSGDPGDPFTGFGDLALGVDDGPSWKRSAGIAVGADDGSVRLEFARALDADPAGDDDGRWQLGLRISRTF